MKTANELLKEVNSSLLRTDLPILKIGDIVTVITKHKNKTNPTERSLSFKGTVISQKNPKQPGHTFTILREVEKIAITAVFSYNSPSIIEIKKQGETRVRRAKLYYQERKLAKKKEMSS